MEADIVVMGTGRASSLPDRAFVRVVVQGRGATSEAAYDQAVGPAGRVDDVLDAHQHEIERASTTGLYVQPTSHWVRGEEKQTGWRATRTSDVRLVVLDAVAPLVAELAHAGASVDGRRWYLLDDNSAHRTARIDAARQARAKAEDYAGALDLILGQILWIAEPEGSRERRQGWSEVTPISVAVNDDADIAVQPPELWSAASVEVGFSIARDR